MIHYASSRREDRVSDAVGCLRIFGSVFVLTGTVALVLALSGLAGLGEESFGTRSVTAAIGAAHLAGGLAFGWGRSVGARVSRAGVEWTERRPFRGTTRRQIAPSQVRDVRVLAERDSDGDDTFRVQLQLSSGEAISLTRQTTPSREYAESIADQVARRLGVAI